MDHLRWLLVALIPFSRLDSILKFGTKIDTDQDNIAPTVVCVGMVVWEVNASVVRLRTHTEISCFAVRVVGLVLQTMRSVNACAPSDKLMGTFEKQVVFDVNYG